MFKRRLLLLFAASVAMVAIAATLSAIPPTSAPSQRPKQVSGADVSLQEVDGGPDYYARFSHPLPNVESYFPIGVWLESVTSQADVDKDRDVGLNLYVTVTANSRLPLISANGLRVIAQQSEWRTRGHEAGADAIAGWELYDEVDMVLGPGAGYPELDAIHAIAAQRRPVPLQQLWQGRCCSGRRTPRQHGSSTTSRTSCRPTPTGSRTRTYARGRRGAGCWRAATGALAPAECRRAANYGATVSTGARPGQPHGFEAGVGVCRGRSPVHRVDAPSIQPAEVRAAVWQSLIAGARGIIYFNHSFGGPNQTQHVLRDPYYAPIRAAVRDHEPTDRGSGLRSERADCDLRVVAGAGDHGDGQVGEWAFLRVRRLRRVGRHREVLAALRR